MEILVIGNGFDLAHGLKTAYKDFLEYCIARSSKRLPMLVNYGTSFIDNIWLRHFINRQNELGDTWIDLEQEIYSAIEIIVKNTRELLNAKTNNAFHPIFFCIKKDVTNFEFNDISNYIKLTSQIFSVNNEGYTYVETSDFSSLYIYIASYQGFVNFLYDQLREFTKEFEKYLIDDIRSLSSIDSKYRLLMECGTLYVLSFNYTDICENLYKYSCNTSCQDLRIKPIYIHGKTSQDDNCNLVLGTHSFENSNIPVEFNVFKKHNQRHKYATIEAYQDFLKILLLPNVKPAFHVVGHSLDKTDHNILKHAFLVNKNATINIYYHNEEAQERLINNITGIIGEEEVMTRVRMIYQHDKKRGILIPKE